MTRRIRRSIVKLYDGPDDDWREDVMACAIAATVLLCIFGAASLR